MKSEETSFQGEQQPWNLGAVRVPTAEIRCDGYRGKLTPACSQGGADGWLPTLEGPRLAHLGNSFAPRDCGKL